MKWTATEYSRPPFDEGGTFIYDEQQRLIAKVQTDGDATKQDVLLILAAPELFRLVRHAFESGAFSHIAGMNDDIRGMLARIEQAS
jgi:hypothetical protein